MTLDALRALTIGDLAWDIAAITIIVVAILGIGLLLERAILRDAIEDPIAELVLVVGLGISGYGALLFLFGFLPVLSRVPLTVLSLLAAGAGATQWRAGAALTALGSVHDRAGCPTRIS